MEPTNLKLYRSALNQSQSSNLTLKNFITIGQESKPLNFIDLISL